jgi:hypothetical protein
MLDDGLWEADARVELEELASEVDPRLAFEEDEVDTVGGMTKATPARSRRAANSFHAAIARTRPKCGTGTLSPSTSLLARRGVSSGAR